jgi:formylglycine-generating enzyme required for sulfatase activity
LTGKAIQRGKGGVDDFDDAGCPNNGNGCTELFAASIPGVLPSLIATWFQAAAACRNAGKELLPNAIWQVAALGTPDPRLAGDGINTCNTYTAGPLPTWSSANCILDVGTFDMVGNVSEWVADWVPVSAGCVNPMFSSGDFNCFAASNVPSPGGLQHQYAAGTSPLAHLPGCSPLMPS